MENIKVGDRKYKVFTYKIGSYVHIAETFDPEHMQIKAEGETKDMAISNLRKLIKNAIYGTQNQDQTRTKTPYLP